MEEELPEVAPLNVQVSLAMPQLSPTDGFGLMTVRETPERARSVVVSGRMQSDLPPLHRTISEGEQITDLVEFERRALNTREFEQFPRRGQAGEFESSAGAQVDAQLFGELVLASDPCGIATRFERSNAFLAERRGGKAGEPCAYGVKFEHTRG